jgi:hypothetical protein
VRAVPVDLARYLGALEERARLGLPAELVALARDHVAFVQSLARQRTLLERRFYVIVPAQAGSETERFVFPPWRRHSRLEAADADAARRQLTFRCEEAARQLTRCGLLAHRLDDTELAHLYLACWSPERARLQRFRQRLEDYTSLAVGAERREERG